MYGARSPVFYVYFDKERATWINTIIWSVEGPRKGCVLSTFLFCLSTQHQINTLVREFPKIKIFAQCDDLIKGVKPVAGESWQDAFERLARCVARQDELMGALGLYRHPEKSKLAPAIEGNHTSQVHWPPPTRTAHAGR